MKVRGREIPQVRRVAYEVAMQEYWEMLLQKSVCSNLWTWIGFGVLLPDSAHPVHRGADHRSAGHRCGQTCEIVTIGRHYHENCIDRSSEGLRVSAAALL